MKPTKEQLRFEEVVGGLFDAMKPKFKYIAQNQDGSWWAYSRRPAGAGDVFIPTGGAYMRIPKGLFDLPRDENMNFEETIIEMNYHNEETGARVIVQGGKEL